MDRRRDLVIDSELSAALAAFDDSALATLANPGLVRRAHRDVEEGKLRLVSAREGRAAVEADGQLVTIDGRGPGAAACECKSVALCRHRIAAVLFLRQLQEEPAGEEEDVGGAEGIVIELDPAAIQRWAGKANWRAALELVETMTLVQPFANSVAVSFEELEEPIRILRGQGLSGIISKAPKSRAKAYHAAAVLAARRHFGAAPPEAADEGEAPAPAVVEVDRAFLDRVAASLCEVAALGFNLAPVPLEESLFELSVSSRADSLPRLSAMLRAIAAQVRLRRRRALAFDPDRLLELAATAFALTRALAAGDQERRARLGGAVRRDFAAAGPLSLIGCGGERWRTDSGARGVTAWFMEAGTGGWLSASLARGAGQDPSFNPAEAWQGQPMWQSEPLAVLAHARIELEGARRSSEGRLSAPAAARARVVGRDVRPDDGWPGLVREWSELREAWLRQTGLGLEADESPTACLLAPTGAAPPYFDDLAQQLVWPLRDSAGEWLALTLDQESVSSAIGALEANVRSGWEGFVLARLMRTGDMLEVCPVTLFRGGGAIDLTLWRAPYSAPGSGGGAVRSWLARLKADNSLRFARTGRGGTDSVLAAAWRHLLDCAETGPALTRSIHGGAGSGIAAHAERLDGHGLPALAGLLREGGASAGLLAAAYGLLVARQQRVAAPLLR
jgi:hypothetical protein